MYEPQREDTTKEEIHGIPTPHRGPEMLTATTAFTILVAVVAVSISGPLQGVGIL